MKGYAAPDVMRPDQVRAYRDDGVELRVVAVADSEASGNKRVPVPRYRVAGPLPSAFTLRYRVSPGRREGDEHLGFTGRAFGHLGRDFGLITGRTLFLLPEPAASFGAIRVVFDLPKGWTAVTPWKPTQNGFLVEAPRAKPFELLATATIGLGSFRESAFSVGKTSVRVDFSSAVPEMEERRTEEAIERVTRYVFHAFGRDLGEQYSVVVASETPELDEIVGEGWAYGQGGTLSPLTPERLRRFAQRLIEAYTLHAPFRTEIRHPEEFWVIDGITNWYSWRAVASAGLADEDQVGHSLASGYLTAMTTPGIERDLERMYAAGSPERVAREVLAPFVLLYLDHQLRARDSIPSGFDGYLPRLYATGSAPSLWSLVGGRNSSYDWGRFRAWYVRGKDLAPIPDLFPIAPTRAAPSPAGGPPVRYLTVAYSGNTYGYLENCGCKANQSGGVARRATMLGRIRSRDPSAIVLDAGNTFPRPERSNTPSFLADGEQRLYLETVDIMRYNAAAVGLTELAWGPEYFRGNVGRLATPYLAANVLWAGKQIGPRDLALKSRGITMDVIGVLEPPRGGPTVRRFSESTTRLAFLDPVEEVRKIAAQRSSADLLVVLGNLNPWTIRRIAATSPDVDLVISTSYDGPHWLPPSGHSRPIMAIDDSTGFLGRTLVLYTYRGQYGISAARLGVDQDGRIVSAARQEYWLDESVPDSPAIRDRLNRFYDGVGKSEMAQASVHPPLGGDPYWQHGRYTGAARCAECHAPEYEQWKTTQHATAFKTLLDRHRHYQPTCVSCHVVGFGSRSGYKVGDDEVPLGNVQCEVCHGPGQEHATNPLSTNIRRAVPEHVCLECHNPDHSDHFIYAERLPAVLHEKPARLTSP